MFENGPRERVALFVRRFLALHQLYLIQFLWSNFVLRNRRAMPEGKLFQISQLYLAKNKLKALPDIFGLTGLQKCLVQMGGYCLPTDGLFESFRFVKVV